MTIQFLKNVLRKATKRRLYFGNFLIFVSFNWYTFHSPNPDTFFVYIHRFTWLTNRKNTAVKKFCWYVFIFDGNQCVPPRCSSVSSERFTQQSQPQPQKTASEQPPIRDRRRYSVYALLKTQPPFLVFSRSKRLLRPSVCFSTWTFRVVP